MKEIVEKWFSITQSSHSYLSHSVRELVLEKGIATQSNDAQLNYKALSTDLLDIENLLPILKNDGISLHENFVS